MKTSLKKIRLLIIGLNPHHIEHINSLKSFLSVEVVGVCNINLAKASKVALQFENPKIYLDYRAAIEFLKPDAVFISLPHDIHMEVVEFAINNGVHVFKEKPFAYNLDFAKKTADLIEKSQKCFMVVSQRRFHKTYMEAKNLLSLIGNITYVHACYCFNKPTTGWRMKKEKSGGGVLIDSGYHLIDILNYYFGLPEKVSCKTFKLSDIKSCETEDCALVKFLYSDNKVCQLVLNRTSKEKKEEIIVYGELGKITVTKTDLILELFNNGFIEKRKVSWDDFKEAYQNQHNSFFSSMQNNEKPSFKISDVLINSIIIEACYLSAKNNSNLINIKDVI